MLWLSARQTDALIGFGSLKCNSCREKIHKFFFFSDIVEIFCVGSLLYILSWMHNWARSRLVVVGHATGACVIGCDRPFIHTHTYMQDLVRSLRCWSDQVLWSIRPWGRARCSCVNVLWEIRGVFFFFYVFGTFVLQEREPKKDLCSGRRSQTDSAF